MVTRFKTPKLDSAAIYQQALHALKTTAGHSLPQLDALIHVVADIFHCPMVTVALCSGNQLNFISSYGSSVNQVEIEHSFSGYVYRTREPLVVYDAASDERFHLNPFVQGKPFIKCFAGMPLSLQNGDVTGALGIYFYQSVTLSASQLHHLQLLSHAVEGLLDSHLNHLQTQVALDVVEQERQIFSRKDELSEEVAKVSGVGGWAYDVKTQEVFWTQKTRDIHEVTDDYLPNLENAYSFYAPEYQDSIQEIVEQGLKSSGLWEFELPLITAKGRHIWVKVTGKATYEDGQVVRMYGGFQDITQRRMVDKKLRASERIAKEKSKELTAIINHMPQGVAVFRPCGRLKYWNLQYLTLFDKLPDDPCTGVTFQNFLELKAQQGEMEGSAEQFLKKMHLSFSQGKSVRLMYHLLSGKIIDALYSPLPDGCWLSIAEDVTEREKASRHITHVAYHDTLTGVANRMLFNSKLSQALNDIQRNETGSQYMLLLIDLDYFKIINDTYGHTIGDSVLNFVAQRLGKSVRDKDIVARFGGDEFAILLAGREDLHQQAENIAQRILESLSMPYKYQGTAIDLGVSIGISDLQEEDASINDPIQRADIALYNVKSQGRNTYLFYSDELSFPTPNQVHQPRS